MIERTLHKKLSELTQKYPIVTLTGPRQSGKSTLLRHAFPNYKYVSLEDPDMRLFATDDPRGFLKTYPDKTIIDEAQRVPALFSYIQTHTDKEGREGIYLLAGSHNFLLMENINQSLAGRTAILKLLPFSHAEMKESEILPRTVDDEIFNGGYPRLYDKDIAPSDYYPFYIQTYVERDVRLMKNIGDLSKFIRFIKLCAGRIGQLLNLSSLANECGVAVSTISTWISVLEASYICYLLKPDHNNYAKRLVKTPKLYFYDTGLACSLLDIRTAEQVSTHFLRGGLFENLVINEFVKQAYNKGEEPNLTFWRDSTGNEVDLLQYIDGKPYAYEIKSGATYSPDFFKGIAKWAKLSGANPEQCFAIYNGEKNMKTSAGEIIKWYNINRCVMPLRIDVPEKFLNLFHKIFENEPIENGNKLNLFSLKISNNAFSYATLVEELGDILTAYALSRSAYDELCSQKKYTTLVSKAKERLRKAESNDGELGEILLYTMLEAHLKAPKLLTKLELKTDPNHYVNGADGVHLLKIDDNTFQFIFGESKLYSDLKKGVKKAFESLKNLLKEDLNKLRYEIQLVNSNFLKEAHDEHSVDLLKKLLIPRENDEDLNIDHSFGIFLGFDVEITDDERKLNNADFRETIYEKVENAVRAILPTINDHIKQDDFRGYSFYIYIVPFSELKKQRKKMIAELKK